MQTSPRNALSVFAALSLVLFTFPVHAQDDALEQDIVLREALVIGKTGQFGRAMVHRDPVQYAQIMGTWTPPNAGDTVTAVGGDERVWKRAEARPDGWLMDRALRGGYVSWRVELPEARTMILNAAGHSSVSVNGVRRAGDPYGYGWQQFPVELKAGLNELLFHVSRGRLKARLIAPEVEVYIDTHEPTLPTLISGDNRSVLGGLVIVNAGDEPREDLYLIAGGGGLPQFETKIPAINARTMRKVPFHFGGAVASDVRHVDLRLELVTKAGGVLRILDSAVAPVGVRQPDERHVRTFISDIDGSVQYYAITPMKAAEGETAPERPALFLTLHGASVEGSRQAAVYRPKSWGHVVAPTNRRPYGFDWEEWGRIDTLEVLGRAMRELNIDENRVYLTGHSMGGHGAWQVGATHPDRFAAIAPSAGWVSFWSYVSTPRYDENKPIERMLRRSTNPSDTLALARNYLNYGIYILHGEKDDNVPAEQAKIMMRHLEGFHDDYTYHEEPGAGHWWGDRCCDWPPIFEFFKQRVRTATEDVRHIEFHTASPGVSAVSQWAIIEQQHEQMEISSIVADLDDEAGTLVCTTDNIARCAFDFSFLPDGTKLNITMDGENVGDATLEGENKVVFMISEPIQHFGARWSIAETPMGAWEKGPHRSGPFKDAFRHRMVFVYGTQGDEEENAWAWARARHDAESFWYRGNGAVDVIADSAFRRELYPDRGVILYGNADTNSAWALLLAECPVQVKRGAIDAGDYHAEGDDLGVQFVYPRPDSPIACVGVICGTGVVGARTCDRIPLFLAGVGVPDLVIVDSTMLRDGVSGVRAAGFFGNDWSIETGQFDFPAP